MTIPMTSPIRTAIDRWLVAIACSAMLAGGCQFQEYPFWWEATGEQAAAFRPSLDEARDRDFVVLQLNLDGAEGHGPSPAVFREEVVLALYLNEDSSTLLR